MEQAYSKGWFADPFILEVTNSEIVLIVEEYEYKKRKGRISEIIVDKSNYKLKSVCPVLEKDTHLSFPYIIKDESKVYVCPENYASGGVYLYRRRDDGQLVEPIKIIDSPLVDTQFLKKDDTYYAFGVETVTGKNEESRVLKIYKSSAITKPFVFWIEIKNLFSEERGAGLIYNNDQMIIRPAQSCERSYGDSLIFYQMKIEENSVKEVLINRLYPKMFGRYGLGLHTFNFEKGIYVVDGKDYRQYPISQIAKIFK